MKRGLICALALIALLTAFCCAESTDEGEALKAKYEESVVFKTVETICRVGTDQISRWQTNKQVKPDSPAWNLITRFDAGFFITPKTSLFLDRRSENWVRTSETTFECDVYMNNRITFAHVPITTDYPCAYHMYFELTDKRKDTWLLTDFYSLPIQSEVDKAARYTAENEGISVYTVEGKSFRGYMMVVDDPSRVFVGTIDRFSNAVGGMRLDALTQKYHALAAINGGCFQDGGEISSGGVPIGCVYSMGKSLGYNNVHDPASNVIMGFDVNDKLIVGTFKNDQLEQLKLRDALAFHPALVLNGEKTKITDSLRYSARTAIGQDGEGRVLMLVTQGRQPNCLGACFEDLQDIMLAFGAVNAGNLDGGHSTAMYLAGESVYSGYPLDVSRRMPATFLVKYPGE